MRHIGRPGNVHFFEQLVGEESVLPAFEGVAPAGIVPGRRAQSAFAVHEDVVLRPNVVAAVGEDRAEGAAPRVTATREDVALYQVPAVAVVEVDRGVAVTHGTADVMPVVKAD